MAQQMAADGTPGSPWTMRLDSVYSAQSIEEFCSTFPPTSGICSESMGFMMRKTKWQYESDIAGMRLLTRQIEEHMVSFLGHLQPTNFIGDEWEFFLPTLLRNVQRLCGSQACEDSKAVNAFREWHARLSLLFHKIINSDNVSNAFFGVASLSAYSDSLRDAFADLTRIVRDVGQFFMSREHMFSFKRFDYQYRSGKVQKIPPRRGRLCPKDWPPSQFEEFGLHGFTGVDCDEVLETLGYFLSYPTYRCVLTGMLTGMRGNGHIFKCEEGRVARFFLRRLYKWMDEGGAANVGQDVMKENEWSLQLLRIYRDDFDYSMTTSPELWGSQARTLSVMMVTHQRLGAQSALRQLHVDLLRNMLKYLGDPAAF